MEEFYKRLQPFAIPFMALFERDRLPSRSALSRFLAALTEAPVEALRTLFLEDLLARLLSPDKQTGGLVDRAGNSWVVFDIDGNWSPNGCGTRRLELGHQLHPDAIRTTEFAPALPPPPPSPHTAPPSGYTPPHVGLPWKAGRFSGQDFALQADGTLRCPADQKLIPHEQRREADGSLRIVYGASIGRCRPCPLREQCQWQGSATAKPEPA